MLNSCGVSGTSDRTALDNRSSSCADVSPSFLHRAPSGYRTDEAPAFYSSYRSSCIPAFFLTLPLNFDSVRIQSPSVPGEFPPRVPGRLSFLQTAKIYDSKKTSGQISPAAGRPKNRRCRKSCISENSPDFMHSLTACTATFVNIVNNMIPQRSLIVNRRSDEISVNSVQKNPRKASFRSPEALLIQEMPQIRPAGIHTALTLALVPWFSVHRRFSHLPGRVLPALCQKNTASILSCGSLSLHSIPDFFSGI